jgi:hypothetical protein
MALVVILNVKDILISKPYILCPLGKNYIGSKIFDETHIIAISWRVKRNKTSYKYYQTYMHHIQHSMVVYALSES